MEIVDFTILAAICCFVALDIMMLVTFGKLRRDFSEPRGSTTAGIIYAFTAGMMPKAKESASQHLLSYFAGILFHIGIFTSFLSTALIYLALTGFLLIPHWLFFLMIALITIGLVNGIGLLIKRIVNRRLRAISHFDDYFSNIMVNIFLTISVIALLYGSNIIFNIMYLVEGVLFLYIPLGKLRHCAYFIATRIMFGIFYGHRGILPRSNKSIL